jgi:dsDNA-binding SOS-regulon protein
MLDAAQSLAALIKQGDFQSAIDSKTIDDISIYLAKNASAVTEILKSIKPFKTGSMDSDTGKSIQSEPADDKKKAHESKIKVKNRAN